MYRKLVTLIIALFFSINVLAQAVADPGYWNMQRAMGGIMQQAAQARGYSTTDPRTYGSLYSIGKTAASTAAAAGTGFLVIGTSPGWASVLAVAAVSAGVGYAVNLGLDALVQWKFGALTSSTPVTMTSVQITQGIYQPPTVPGVTCTTVNNISDWCNTSSQATSFSMCWPSNMTYNPTCACSLTCRNQFPPGTFTAPYPTSLSGTMAALGFTNNPTSTPVTTTASMATQVTTMPTPEKTQPLNYKTMALLLNELWKKAATATDYAGIPYPATQPITETEVEAWAQANPQTYPTVAALTTAVSTSTATASSATGFQLSTTADSSTAPQTATSSTPTTGTNAGQANPVTNLGTDPNIGAPGLEQTPTAKMIMEPILTLFPSFKNYSVPGHNGQCPKPSFSAFSKTFVFQSHCSLLEDNRTALTNSMLLVFALAALFIVFSA
jgi:hypothetical protein